MSDNKNLVDTTQLQIFTEKTGITLEIRNGRPYYKGNIYVTSNCLPDYLVIDGDLYCSAYSTKLPRGLKIKKFLYIRDTKITEIPDDCEYESLCIRNSPITNLRDNLTLRILDVEYSSLKSLPRKLKVKEALIISHTSIREIPDDCEFSFLNAEGSLLIKLRDNLCIAFLNISNTLVKEVPKHLIVCEFLDICNTSITQFPKDCFVGSLYCDFDINDERYEKNGNCYNLKENFSIIDTGNNEKFIIVYNILYKILKVEGNVFKVIESRNKEINYIVVENDDCGLGLTLEGAKLDLLYNINHREEHEYRKLTPDDELTFIEAIVCYRNLTGACSDGIAEFLEKRLPKPHKEKYSIKEIMDLTDNEYGNNYFCEYFERE